MDGKYDCKNRADEEAFRTEVGNSSSLLLDLEQLLEPCKDRDGIQGFICSDNEGSRCLPMYEWCNTKRRKHNSNRGALTCNELIGTTATGKTIDHQMCSNQSFWEHKGCGARKLDPRLYMPLTPRRCTGDAPGQCEEINDDNACRDGSSEIKPAQGGSCGRQLMCKARGGVWKGMDVCMDVCMHVCKRRKKLGVAVVLLANVFLGWEMSEFGGGKCPNFGGGKCPNFRGGKCPPGK